MEKSLLRLKAEQIECPRCHAKAGEQCKYTEHFPADGSKNMPNAFHIARYDAAKIILNNK